MKTLTRETYARRIERVVDYLIDHLDGEVDLHRLAEEAFLSPYHFHRVYHGMTGETIAETVRRLRLHRAAVKLISSDIAISTLATEAGYGSVQAFNRAFREGYGTPPAAYRAKQARIAALQTRHPASALTAEEKGMFEVTVKQMRSHRVVALQHRGDYMNIGNTFERLSIWAAGQGLMDKAVRCFAIYYDDPAAKPKEALVSEACLEFPVDVTPPPEYRVIDTPAGRCATLVYKGPYSDLEKPYTWLFGEWLPKSGEEPDNQPCFEEYLNDVRSTPPQDLLTAVYMPLKG